MSEETYDFNTRIERFTKACDFVKEVIDKTTRIINLMPMSAEEKTKKRKELADIIEPTMQELKIIKLKLEADYRAKHGDV